MTGMVKSGWYADPTHRYRVRYREGREWTAWVAADDDGARLDPEGAAVTPRRKGRLAIGLTVLAVFGLLFVGGLVAWVQAGSQDARNAEQTFEASRPQQRVAEADAWHLPDTLTVSSTRVQAGKVIRSFSIAGSVNAESAAEELVAMLRRQGYDDLEEDGVERWTGSCYASLGCRLSITVEGNQVLVVLRV
jgi:hypothetical protein